VQFLTTPRLGVGNLFAVYGQGRICLLAVTTLAANFLHFPTKLVSSAAVIWAVTQRFSGGKALHDDPNNSCGGDYYQTSPKRVKTEEKRAVKWKRRTEGKVKSKIL